MFFFLLSFLLFIAFVIIYVPFIDGKSQVHVIKTTKDYKMPNLFKQVIMIMGRQISICKQNAHHSRKRNDANLFFVAVSPQCTFAESYDFLLLISQIKSDFFSTTWTLIFCVYPRIDQFVTDKEIDFFWRAFNPHGFEFQLNFKIVIQLNLNDDFDCIKVICMQQWKSI